MTRVQGSTRVYAVIGHPVAHSLSPPMLNAAFLAAGLDAAYVAFDVTPENLAPALDGLHRAGAAGLNVTLPHKEAAVRACARLTDAARSARVVNTLKREEDGWHGHATDGEGFRTWLSELGVVVRGARVLLLGAGGAAASIAPVLAGLGAGRLCVVSRNGGRAQSLVAGLRLAGAAGVELSARPLGEAVPEQEPRFDLLIRALSAESVAGPEAAWWAALAPGAPVLDLNYGARADEPRERARRDGRRFEDGLGLLLHQGALSYEFWTGERAPLPAMRAALHAV